MTTITKQYGKNKLLDKKSERTNYTTLGIWCYEGVGVQKRLFEISQTIFRRMNFMFVCVKVNLSSPRARVSMN